MKLVRVLVTAAIVTVALILQVSVFPHVAWHGIVPDLCLLVVVAAALARGPVFGMLTGFAAGAALDLAPPADHVVGRWALALVLVGYLAGQVRPERTDARATLGQSVLTVAAASFVGNSVFALTGLVFADHPIGSADLVSILLVALVWDVLLTVLVLPPLMRLFTSLDPVRTQLR